MKHLKRITALAMAAMMVFGCAVTAHADDNYAKLKNGQEYTIVGKGVEDDSIVMNLNDREKVTGIYYITIPETLKAPQHIVKVEDLPHPDKAEIDVFYNETLEMYGIRIIAKELLDTSFTLRYITEVNGVKQAYAFKNVPLTVIDDDRFITSLDPESEEYEEALEELQKKGSVVNVLEGLKESPKGQRLVVDISQNEKISNAWLKQLSKMPENTLICAGDNYALKIKGSDAKYKNLTLEYKVNVEISNTKLNEWEKKTGVKDARPVIVSGMKKLPAKAKLKLRISGVAYRNASVNLYKFENGKTTKIASGVKTDGFGVLEFPDYAADGTYIVSRF